MCVSFSSQNIRFSSKKFSKIFPTLCFIEMRAKFKPAHICSYINAYIYVHTSQFVRLMRVVERASVKRFSFKYSNKKKNSIFKNELLRVRILYRKIDSFYCRIPTLFIYMLLRKFETNLENLKSLITVLFTCLK